MSDKTKSSISIVIAVAALGFSVFTYFDTSSDQHDLRYKLSALEFQPRLKLINSDIIKAVNMNTDPFAIMRDSSISVHQDSIKALPIHGTFTLKFLLRVRNIGNALAKGIAYLCVDSNSFDPMLRTLITTKDPRLVKMIGQVIERPNEILPGDSVDLILEHKIEFIENNRFTVHFLILYQNELGNFSDTYVWANAEVKDIVIDLFQSKDPTKPFSAARVFPSKSKDMIKIVEDPTSTYNTYSEQETERIQWFLSKLDEGAAR